MARPMPARAGSRGLLDHCRPNWYFPFQMGGIKMKIRALQLISQGRLSWEEIELPAPEGGQVLIKTEYSAVDAGSQLPIFTGQVPGDYPRFMGWEVLGRVTRCGPDVKRIKPGDQVLAFYGHREEGLTDQDQVIVVPEGVSHRIALLSGISSQVVGGIRKVNPRPRKPVLISGAGMRGLFTLFVLKASGKEYVDVIEPVDERRELARGLGARFAVTPEESVDVGGLYPVAFECSNSNESFQRIQSRMLPGGSISVIADTVPEELVLSREFYRRDLQLFSTSFDPDSHVYARWFFDNVEGYEQLLETMFTEEVSTDELPGLFDRIKNESRRPLRILVKY